MYVLTTLVYLVPIKFVIFLYYVPTLYLLTQKVFFLLAMTQFGWPRIEGFCWEIGCPSPNLVISATMFTNVKLNEFPSLWYQSGSSVKSLYSDHWYETKCWEPVSDAFLIFKLYQSRLFSHKVSAHYIMRWQKGHIFFSSEKLHLISQQKTEGKW